MLKDIKKYLLINKHLVCLIFIFYVQSVYANEEFYDLNTFPSDFGGVGLIQTPTARFSQDGTLTWGASNASPYNRLYVAMTFLPRVEAVVRYTEINNRLYSSSPAFSGDQTAKDKSADIKFGLVNEGKYMPQIAIGLRDIGGTSDYGAEYIVANKHWKDFDFSVGLGFGLMGRRANFPNPFRLVNSDFKNRGKTTGGIGGTLNEELWFKGEKASLWGGLKYQTAIPNLSITLEYDPNDYQDESGVNKQKIDVDSPINIGLDYLLLDRFYISANLQRGNLISFNISKPMNFSKQFGPNKFIPQKENLYIRNNFSFNSASRKTKKQLVDNIIIQMANEGLATHAVIFDDKEITVEISQKRFRPTIYAVDLASRILAYNAPNNIERITVNNLDFGLTNFSSTIEREKLVDLVSKGPLREDQINLNKTSSYRQESNIYENPYMYPHFAWSLTPTVRTVLGGPDGFLLWQLQAKLKTVTSFKKGLYLETEVHRKIKDNFDKWKLPSDSIIPHVRTDMRLYWKTEDTSLARMQLDYLFRLSPSIVGRISGGILEEMFGGIGAELLYFNPDRSWAFGLNAYRVKQREYDQRFDFRDYEITTGHATLYYDLPFYNLSFKTSVGRFLAGDKGVMLDLSRRYNNGVEVGARVALTNLSAREYGEGSFGKWIYGNIPMDLFSQNGTRDKTFLEWSPLLRDGGQKLKTGKDLYVMMKNPYDEISGSNRTKKHWTIPKFLSGFHTGKK
tara:strand:+ start:220 stop:2424 length:2205 start_codon:yes stop_codon:yes gene_type:complete